MSLKQLAIVGTLETVIRAKSIMSRKVAQSQNWRARLMITLTDEKLIAAVAKKAGWCIMGRSHCTG